jgi:hypothetical protein
MLIHRVVWETILCPWFAPMPIHEEDYGTGHFRDIGEDLAFSDLVRSRGFKIWLAADHGIEHYHSVPLSKIVMALQRAKAVAK